VYRLAAYISKSDSVVQCIAAKRLDSAVHFV
jgi:hypothetical protein